MPTGLSPTGKVAEMWEKKIEKLKKEFEIYTLLYYAHFLLKLKRDSAMKNRVIYSIGNRYFAMFTSQAGEHPYIVEIIDNGRIKHIDVVIQPGDIIFVTGDRLLADHLKPQFKRFFREIRGHSCKIIFDLALNKVGELSYLRDLKGSVRGMFEKPVDLLIGDFMAWHILFSGRCRDNRNPRIKELEWLASRAKSFAKFACIRYGAGYLGKEALFYRGQLLYIKDTGYYKLSKRDKIGFSEKLTVSIMQQFLLGGHSWVYDESLKFTMPLSILEMPPKEIRENSRILDIGCGYGRALGILKQKGFTNLAGSDISISMVVKARELYPDIDIFHDSVNDLKVKNHKYDVCLLMAVLTTIQYDRDIIELVEDIASLLEPDGLLLISDFLINSDLRNLRRYEKYRSLFPDSGYGTFITGNGMVNRHFQKDFIYSVLEQRFTIINWREEEFRTVNNNVSNGFMLACKKR
ncbi:MAG: class I SAM-dependent methyltransferase [bacterium]|nr:class I SAM-dependent methyltransferase [bacterium]